jgi:hypothetical protein
MRMPILPYFLAVGSTLFVILGLASNQIEPNISAIQVSQMVGLPAPFKTPSVEARSRPAE